MNVNTAELPINDRHPGAFSDPVWGTGQVLVVAWLGSALRAPASKRMEIAL